MPPEEQGQAPPPTTTSLVPSATPQLRNFCSIQSSVRYGLVTMLDLKLRQMLIPTLQDVRFSGASCTSVYPPLSKAHRCVSLFTADVNFENDSACAARCRKRALCWSSIKICNANRSDGNSRICFTDHYIFSEEIAMSSHPSYVRYLIRPQNIWKTLGNLFASTLMRIWVALLGFLRKIPNIVIRVKSPIRP